MKENMNLHDILEEIEYCDEREKQYTKEIECFRFKKDHSLNLKQRKYFKDIMKNYKEIIKEIEQEKSDYINIIKNNSTFPSEMIIPFITECISWHEQEEYVNSRIVLNYSYGVSDMYCQNFVNYYLIFNKALEETEQELEKSFLVSHSPACYADLLKGTKKIIAPYYSELSMLTEEGLKGSLREFPYLNEIAFDLVERRLQEPEKPLEEILNDELELVKTVNRKLKKD